jgi:catechol 2,3-dioxygenase-like lactoylglutathione lyase family enzyme
MSDRITQLSVCQVAFSTLDLAGTMRWWREAFGFVDSGSNPGQGGPEVAAMQGLPEAELDMAWLVDRQDFFQLEFFRFAAPVPRPRWTAVDEAGYSAVTLVVDDFDATLDRLRDLGTGAERSAGAFPRRRALVRDPEGVLVEITEQDHRRPEGGLPTPVRPWLPVAVRGIRIVAADPARAQAFLTGLGMRPAAARVLGPEHEDLWGPPADEVVEMWAGDFLVELVAYAGGGTPRRPADYRISDQGLLNIALGSRSVADYEATVARLGPSVRSHRESHIGPAVVRYLSSDQDLSVEILAIPDPAIERAAGFLPLDSARRAQ